MGPRIQVVLLLMAVASRLPAQTNPKTSAVEQDYLAGRRLLDAAIAATGDSVALAGLGMLETSFCARAVEIGQSAAPDAPYDTISAKGHRLYDLRGRRYAQDWSTDFRGGLPLVLHETVTDTSAYSTDLRGGLVLAVAPGGLQASQRRVEDNSPFAPLALLDRARRNAATIRIVRTASDSEPDAMLFDDRSIVTTLRFDRKTHLLIGADALFDNWAVGLAPFLVRFGNYQRIGGVQLARRVTTRFQHDLLTDITFPDLALASRTPALAFNPPADLAGAVSIGGPLHITIDSVAPHVWVIRYGQTAAPNFGYNAPFAYAQLLVELGDRLLLVDAPWSSGAEQSMIDSLRGRFPAKPIGMVAFTHYHSDHFGGLRPFLLKGATLITTPGIRGYIVRIAAAAHPSDPAAGPGGSHPLPQIQTFTGARTIADAEAPVELHEIDGGHADEMVIIWLPRQRVLYATDLFGIFPVRGRPGGSYEAERVLAEYVRKAGWEVRTVVSGHGAISPSADLTRVLSTPPAVIRRPHQLAADCRGMSQS